MLEVVVMNVNLLGGGGKEEEMVEWVTICGLLLNPPWAKTFT